MRIVGTKKHLNEMEESDECTHQTVPPDFLCFNESWCLVTMLNNKLRKLYWNLHAQDKTRYALDKMYFTPQKVRSALLQPIIILLL